MNQNPISDAASKTARTPSERLPVELLRMRIPDGEAGIRLRVKKTPPDATPAQDEESFMRYAAFWVVRYGDLAAIGATPAWAFDEFDHLFREGIENAAPFAVVALRDEKFTLVAYRRM